MERDTVDVGGGMKRNSGMNACALARERYSMLSQLNEIIIQ